MDAKIFYGKALGVPVGGTIVDVNEADATTVINAISGLVKELFKGGTAVVAGIGLGMGLLGVLSVISQLIEKKPEEPSMPISTIARIRTYCDYRNFNGILMDDTIDILTQDNKLQIKGEYIIKIEKDHSNYTMYLVDGSFYSGFKFEKKIYNFASISGLQTVKMSDIQSIKGHTITDLNGLKSQLTFALNHSLDDIVKVIGKDTFDKFFVLS